MRGVATISLLAYLALVQGQMAPSSRIGARSTPLRAALPPSAARRPAAWSPAPIAGRSPPFQPMWTDGPAMASVRLPALTASRAFSAGAPRTVGEVVSEQDLAQASADVSGLAVGAVAAILRTDGSWRYATLMEKTDTALIFDVDPEHDTKEFPPDTWAEMVRSLAQPDPVLLATVQTSSVTGKNIAALLMGVLAGSGATLIVFRFRQETSTPREYSLLAA